MMCARWQCYLVCTQCNNQFHDGETFPVFETVRELRAYAKECGWVYWKVQNGTMWDFCPRCKKSAEP